MSNCLATQALSDPNIDANWHTIISQKQFVSSLFSVECPPGLNHVELSMPLIQQYEVLCRTYSHVDITKVTVKPATPLREVPSSFNDTADYFSVYEPLVKLEDSEQRQSQNTDGDKHRKVEFFYDDKKHSGGKSGAIVCEFEVYQDLYSRPIQIGDKLSLIWCRSQDEWDDDITVNKNKHQGSNIKVYGELDADDLHLMADDHEESFNADYDTNGDMSRQDRIEYIGSVDKCEVVNESTKLYKVSMVVETSHVPAKVTKYSDGYYDIRLKELGSVVERRLNAMKRMDDEDSMNQDIWEVIMGVKTKMNRKDFYVPETELAGQWNAPRLRALNESQRLAVTIVLQSRFTIIQGPPGTGKTSNNVEKG